MDALGSLLANTFGSAYIGAMVALVLYGITTLQTYLYYNYYPNDDWGLKSLVAILWIAETLQITFVNRFMYIYLINHFGDPLALLKGHWTLYISILCNLFIATLVQTFFATRIHALAKKLWLTGIIGFLILAHIAFGIGTLYRIFKLSDKCHYTRRFNNTETVVRSFQLEFFTELPKIEFNSALPFAISAVVPDVLISASLCYFLKSGKDNITGIRSTEIMINLLMKYAINRTLLTSAAAIAELVLYAVLPNSFAFLAVDFCIGKLFANTLLATLNARKYVRGMGTDVVPSLPSQGSSNAPTFGSNAFYTSQPQVQVHISGATTSQGRYHGSQVQTQVSGSSRSQGMYSERSRPDGHLDPFDNYGFEEPKRTALGTMV